MTAKTQYHRYSFEEVCFGYETNGLCSNYFLMVRRLNVVHASQSPGLSVLEVCFESETTGLCNNDLIFVKRLSGVNDNQSLGTSVLI